MHHEIAPGQVFQVAYPFVRCEVELMGGEGPELVASWKPGHFETIDGEPLADGEGLMVLDVVDIFQPGHRAGEPGYRHRRYPLRVFYLRRFVNPEGVEFGKTGLKVATESLFKRIAKGYRFEYSVTGIAAPS